MGYGHGLDLRMRIVEAYENGEGSIREVAAQFSVSPTTVQGYVNLKRTTGRLEPHPVSGGVAPLISDENLPKVLELVEAHPDETTEDLADRLAREHHIAVSRPTMGRAFQRLRVTRKKNASRNRAGQPARAEAAQSVPPRREEVARARLHVRR